MLDTQDPSDGVIDIDIESLPPPGTPAFFPTLLSRIRTAAPTHPLDPVVLQSILLCLIAGDKHLVLRTREDDVGLVLKLAISILTSIFGYQTHRLKFRPHSSKFSYVHEQQTTPQFLRSLFLPCLDTPSTTPRPTINGHKQHPRRPSGTKPSTPTPAAVPHLRMPMVRSTSSPGQISSVSANPVSPPHAPRVHTDPVPRMHREQYSLVLPRALVVSGLEHLELPSQRALMQVLAERRVALEGEFEDGVWNLPEGFILVYVCPADPRERPALLTSLVNKFAMSTTITLHPSTRAALTPRTTSTPTLPIPLLPLSLSTPIPPPTPLLPQRLLSVLRTLAETRIHISHSLALYTSDLFSAARHHPALDGTLLGAQARRDADTLIRAARAVGGDYTGAELIRDVAAPREDDDGELSVTEEGSGFGGAYEDAIDDVNSVKIGLAPWDSAMPATSRPSLNRSERGTSILSANAEGDRNGETLDVSEADIARIVPRVISHRLRVRDGPEDEILGGAVYGAAFGAVDSGFGRVGQERTAVKDVLVKILSDV